MWWWLAWPGDRLKPGAPVLELSTPNLLQPKSERGVCMAGGV
jgi:hypothetical protein